ncbi:NAD(P)-dependent alcohol dehydrogenase [Nonomuraea basaltis]|uniref:NAD(P)-dependent alcohol dehydrogenase n=1 Tax=Nonomuraea basaltis TaxID=2495887 RepID=UPI00110C461A|nr:NAD(P)-dependent alcohol dehydrogenase [Nonomuraea basaltis]TMR98438.1 NAD(P)-dependent alcohol dehydrogenase [Nonomuraea basaltis]
MKITAAVSRGPRQPFVLEEVELAEPGDGEILVRMVASSICHTDLATKGMLPDGLPFVLGHEGAGVVEQVGSAVEGVRPGDHVLLSYRSCGACGRCSAGRAAYCERFVPLNTQGTRADGSALLTQAGAPVMGSFFGQSSFATHAVTTPDNTVVVPRDVDLTTSAPLGCGVQTGAGAVLNVLRPGADARFVVYGAGGVGLAALMAAKAAGASRIVAVDPVESRRALAVELGATAVIDPAGDDVVAAVRDHTGGGATHALDTTAVPAVIGQGVQALDAGGVLILVGIGIPEVTIDAQDLIAGGKTVRGSIEGDAVPADFLPRLLRMRANGSLPVEKLITTYPFEEIGQAIADTRAGVAVKPVLVF